MFILKTLSFELQNSQILTSNCFTCGCVNSVFLYYRPGSLSFTDRLLVCLAAVVVVLLLSKHICTTHAPKVKYLRLFFK